MIKKLICALVPAYNEEEVIKPALISLKQLFSPEDIYVVSDGSKDNTAAIARRQGVNILPLLENQGKGSAQEKAIKHFSLLENYRFVLFSDADSRLDQNFLININPFLKKDFALVVGSVHSQRKGLVSAFRTFEYALSHLIYKNAQNALQVITVAPGCASVYSSKALSKLKIKSDTLTEDFDLTIQNHQKKLGKIIYVSSAKVTTQDPRTLRDYWKQVVRWNTGTWQNIFKYKLYKPISFFNLEMELLLLDNLLMLVSIILSVLNPIALVYFAAAMYLVVILLVLFIATFEKKLWIIYYAPLFPVFYIINIASFYYAFFKAVKLQKQGQIKTDWQKVVRYSSK